MRLILLSLAILILIESKFTTAINDYGIQTASFKGKCYFSRNIADRPHEWCTSFLGAITYAVPAATEYPFTNIFSQEVDAIGLKITKGDDMSNVFKEYVKKYKDSESDFKQVLLGSKHNKDLKYSRVSDQQSDEIVFPNLCEMTKADFIYSYIPIDTPRLVTEIYMCNVKKVKTPVLEFKIEKIKGTKPLMFELSGTVIKSLCKFSRIFGKDDPRLWEKCLEKESDKLDNDKDSGSEIRSFTLL